MFQVVAELWWRSEAHYAYLHTLKHTDQMKFYLFMAAYTIFVVILLGYVPIASVVYTVCTVAYFYPILAYLDVYNVVMTRAQMLQRRAGKSKSCHNKPNLNK